MGELSNVKIQNKETETEFQNMSNHIDLPEEEKKLVFSENYDSISTQSPGCCGKYGNALKHLLLWRPKERDKRKLPSNRAGLVNYFSVNWMTKIMWKAFKQGLDKEDLWHLQNEDSADRTCSRIEKMWADECKMSLKMGREPMLWRAVWKSMKTRVLVTIFLALFVNVLQFIGPSVLLKLTLDYINAYEIDHTYGACIVAAMFAVNIVRGAAFNLKIVISTHTATRITGGIQSLIFRKVLKLKNGGEKLSAQIVNILTSDMERLFESIVSTVFLTASPALFLMTGIYSVYIIGPWALLGLTCYLLLYPVMGFIASLQSKLRQITVKKTDVRVGLMGEVLNSMKLIKMYAWEDSFKQKIDKIRMEELKKHKIGALLQAVASTTVPSISILATICTLLGYTLSGYPLNASTAFTIFAMFNAMQFTAGVLPFTIRSIAESKISLARIQKLLVLPEHTKESSGPLKSSLACSIKNATFAWETHSIDVKTKNVGSEEINGTVKQDSCEECTEPALTTPLTQSLEVSPIHSLNRTDSFRGSLKSSPSKGATLIISPTQEKLPLLPEPAPETIETTNILFGINLSIDKGSLVGVFGSVGSGKSSLISALCGDMRLRSGSLQVNGRLSVITQQPWIYNGSLRENVVMGQTYDEARFKRVVEACALTSDLRDLPNGDLTEIGERGVNLSGGQKQRVNIARAVYCERDIYLFDDPLSAVDTKVANHIFGNCIRGLLAGKTVILVTNGTHFLERCDEIIMMKNGRINERGTHENLMSRKADYFELVSYSATGAAKPDEIEFRKRKESMRREKSVKDDGEANGKLIQEERTETGTVSGKVYRTSINVSGGWCLWSIILSVIILFTLARLFSSVWLQMWLDAGDGLEQERLSNQTLYNISYTNDQLKGDIGQNENLWLFQTIYGLSFFFLIITGIFKGIGVTFGVLNGARTLHQDMLTSMLRAPLSFMDTTPVGRILNRFSRDMDEVDIRISFFLEFCLQGLMGIVSSVILVSYLFPLVLIPLGIIVFLFIFIDYMLNAGVRELKRLDSALKSPVLQLLTASINGLTVIRTFDREKMFIQRFNKHLDDHSAAHIIFRLSSRWFSYRMDIMATLVTTAITIICIFTKGHFSTAIAGLALATINGVCSFIPFFMRMKSEFASRMTSVERIIEYAYNIESEAPVEIADTDPSESWPVGEIEMNDVKVRYRKGLPLVLKGITCKIERGEKIGIVGRTGAGKSSLIIALLRLVELDSGQIYIDGVDISKIGLKSLRSAISVIPQDPILFQGTIRYNLDPFNQYNDSEVWQALERAHIKPKICKLPLRLLSEVEAAGENFSVGEKQLICLSRALLRKNKILMLDEATASVDNQTDHFIQMTVKEAFSDCTVLTIAHRLNTVASYDKVLVLDHGLMKEFGSPKVLMETRESMFKEMMKAMGVTELSQLQNSNQVIS